MEGGREKERNGHGQERGGRQALNVLSHKFLCGRYRKCMQGKMQGTQCSKEGEREKRTRERRKVGNGRIWEGIVGHGGGRWEVAGRVRRGGIFQHHCLPREEWGGR